MDKTAEDCLTRILENLYKRLMVKENIENE